MADGRIVVGADRSLLERLADPATNPGKAGSRDLGPTLAAGALASTTVSATVRIAHAAGIEVVATGGIGGVHRGADRSFDVSADIDELAATPITVVCSGAKAILDLPATMELLESRRIPVVGLGTDELPAFYSRTSGLALDASRYPRPRRRRGGGRPSVRARLGRDCSSFSRPARSGGHPGRRRSPAGLTPRSPLRRSSGVRGAAVTPSCSRTWWRRRTGAPCAPTSV